MLVLAQQFWFLHGLHVYTAGGKKLSFVKLFHVFILLLCIFKQFFCAVSVDAKQSGGQISNIESTYEARAWHNEFEWLPQSKNSLWTIFQNFV